AERAPSTPEAVSVPQNQGKPMKRVRNKIGFHTGPGGNPTGIGDWMRRIDAAGIPFFL
ncbi:MAG: hypothetical protein GY943_17880, partial [Chloroflexi bacterium]|nr:hypothetical protein [Chloroflexota bacterium]